MGDLSKAGFTPRPKRQYAWKLTDQDLKTHGGCQWEVGKWNPTGVRAGGSNLCTPAFYHAYPWLEGYGWAIALLHNPRGANIRNPRLWQAEIRGEQRQEGAKIGTQEMRLVAEVEFTPLTQEDRVILAIHCGGKGASNSWQTWAEKWLIGQDRTSASASASASAYAYAYTSASASADAAAADAADAADAYAAAADAADADATNTVRRDAVIAWLAGVGT